MRNHIVLCSMCSCQQHPLEEMLNMQPMAGINHVSSHTKALGTKCSVGFSVAKTSRIIALEICQP